MKKQTVVWTALPYAVRQTPTDDLLQLSVALAPRLWADEATPLFYTLNDFPDWLDLPQKILSATFTAEFGPGIQVPATRAPLDSSQPDEDEPDSGLWKALFDASTIVLPFRYKKYDPAKIRSFPARAIADFIKNLYTRVGTNEQYGAGGAYPPLDVLANDDALCAIETPEHKTARLEKQGQATKNWEREQIKYNEEFGRRKQDYETWIKDRGRLTDVGEIRELEAEKQKLPEGHHPPTGQPPYKPGHPPFIDINDPKPQDPAASSPPEECEPGPHTAEWAAQFEQFRDFYKPHSRDVKTQKQSALLDKLKNNRITQSELAEVIDFHRAIAMLTDYPRLMRRLGLVVDLTVKRTAQVPAGRTIRIIADWNSTLPTLNFGMRTLYRIDGTRFFAVSQTNTISRGMVHLGSAGYVTAQVDIDGAAFKLTNLAGDLRNDLTNPNAPTTTSLPALRTGGIALLRSKPDEALRDKVNVSNFFNKLVDEMLASPSAFTPHAQNPLGQEVVNAEALVRGYRVDVFDDKRGKWLSLHERVGQYHFTKPKHERTLKLTDEGVIKPSATAEPGTVDAALAVHEALAVWQGWSLAVPMPGKAIAIAGASDAEQDSSNDEPDLQESNTNALQTDFGLETTFTPAGKSLPRLRFGHTYRLRVRAVDLAGNCVPLDTDATVPAIPEATVPLIYRRFEPVSQPFLVPLKSFEHSDGESLERLVIRTRSTPTIETTERHVVPPKTAQLTAELHQMFDGASQLKRDQAGYDLAKREAAVLHEIDAGAMITVRYLPDPLARGAVLLGLPGLGETAVIVNKNKLPFTGTYPDLNSFRIILKDGTGEPKWDAQARTLTFFLPKGETARVRLASYVSPDDLQVLGVWDWILSTHPPNLAALLQRAQDGRHWMLTPYRTLTLVHAVSQPLSAPKFASLEGDRDLLGKSAATIRGEVSVDRKSTAHVDVLAAWSDPIDDSVINGNKEPLRWTKNSSTLRPVSVPFTDNGQTADFGVLKPSTTPVPFQLRHDFPDTKYHRVTYSAMATTRFRDYFTHEVETGLNITRVMADKDTRSLHIASTARPAAPKIAYIVPTFKWDLPSHKVDGLIAHHIRIGGGLRVYLERPWYSSGDGELLGVVFHEKEFTSLPTEVLTQVTQWSMDTFWEVNPHPPTIATYKNFEEYTYPDPKHLKDQWSLDEMNDPVFVAAYPVAFDAERNLWFSDIWLNLGKTYTPFVRLALVRCQPHSLQGAELSRVVLGEFMQLTPKRELRIHPPQESGTRKSVFLEIYGTTYQPMNVQEPREFQFRVQARPSDSPGDLEWEDLDDVEGHEFFSTFTKWNGEVVYPSTSKETRLIVMEIEKPSSQSSRVIYADVAPLTRPEQHTEQKGASTP